MAAINIQRGRDHGLPSYTSWRVPCGLSPVNSWRDLLKVFGPESTDRIRQAYQSVNDIDLFVGGLAERPVIGGLVGPTFACILAQQFSNLRKGDRFWYENGGFESSFTPAQLASVRQVTLSQVLCRQVNGGTLQPHAFLPPDMAGNERQFCGEQSLIALDLIPWTERDPLNKQHDIIPPPPSPLNNNNINKRPTIIALRPQLIPNNTPITTNGANKNKKKNKTKNKKRKKPTVTQKEGVETKLDFDHEPDTFTDNRRNMTLVAKTDGQIDTKLDSVPTMTKPKNATRTETPNDKLDFDEARTTLSTQRPLTTADRVESRAIATNIEPQTFVIPNWDKRDPNTLQISISWNNWENVRKPESKPLAPMLHDKIGDDEVQFWTGTGGQMKQPENPPPINNSPFSYDTPTRPPPTNNYYTNYWTANDIPVVTPAPFDIRNTVKFKPKPVGTRRPTYSNYPPPQTHLHYGTKRPTYFYPNAFKQTTDKDKKTFTVPSKKTPFSFSNQNSLLESKALPSDTDPNVTSVDDKTITVNKDGSSDPPSTTSSPNETLLTADLLTSSSSVTLSDISLPTTNEHKMTTTTDSDSDLDNNDETYDDYDTSTLSARENTDDHTEQLTETEEDEDDEDDQGTLTQFDKDGYLRPEYMHFDQLTPDPEEKLNKDFRTIQAVDRLLNNTEPRRPAVDIESDLDIQTNEQKRETIAFVPLKILNSADR